MREAKTNTAPTGARKEAAFLRMMSGIGPDYFLMVNGMSDVPRLRAISSISS
jgi:hypothetical protein